MNCRRPKAALVRFGRDSRDGPANGPDGGVLPAHRFEQADAALSETDMLVFVAGENDSVDEMRAAAVAALR
jgi:hypothetical protein